MECLDVAGWTMYFGIFHGSTPYEGTRDFIEKAHERWPDKPIMNTEYGIWSNADESFIEKQVEIYRDVQHALLEKATVAPSGAINERGYLAVMDYWTVYDWYVNHNRFYQTMGMYHMDREGKKPLYHHFVRDHQRLIQQTQGMGIANKVDVREELQVVQQLEYSSIHLSFIEPQDLREWNYLSIKVMDPESSDGFSVQITDKSGGATVYPFYGIKVNEEFDVCIPLWELDQGTLKEATSITLGFKENRKLKVLAVEAAVAGV